MPPKNNLWEGDGACIKGAVSVLFRDPLAFLMGTPSGTKLSRHPESGALESPSAETHYGPELLYLLPGHLHQALIKPAKNKSQEPPRFTKRGRAICRKLQAKLIIKESFSLEA